LIILLSASCLVFAYALVRDDQYQIQGVQIEQDVEFEVDHSKHAAHARRKREADLDAHASAHRNKSESRRQAGYYEQLGASSLRQPVARPKALQVVPGPFDAHVRPLRHFFTLPPLFLQQPQQPQQPNLPPGFNLPANGFSPSNALQQAQLSAFLSTQQPQQFSPAPLLQQQSSPAPQLLQQFSPAPQLQQRPQQQLFRPAPPSFTTTALRTTAVQKKKGTNYYYPPRQPLPLPKCFHNPTGYVCCNEALNDLMVDTYTVLEQRPKFHACNIQLIATHLQLNAQRHFNTSFETLVGYEDFAQKINFRGDMVCKVELGSRYMLAYATASDAYNHDLGGHRREKRETGEFEWSSGHADSWSSVHSSFL
ncbi:hypothetical protein PFISCL1PPCAC_26265, partial [Pristionchus fissidentatus]